LKKLLRIMADREVLINVSKDEIERSRLMSEYKYELDTQSRLVHAERQGEQKGRAEGRREGRQEMIELLKSGKSLEEIIKDFDE